jgi:hypothetical protein
LEPLFEKNLHFFSQISKMKSKNILLILCIVGVFIAAKFFYDRTGGKSSVGLVPVRSKIDSREYYVQDKPDKQDAADALAQVRGKMIALIECLKRSSKGSVEGSPPDDEKKFGSYASRVDRLIKRFNADRISEGNEDIKYTTYTLNKGEKMVFCLRARGEDDRVHDIPMMTFVAIHEMGHVASVTEHHTPEFHSNFAWLLRHAVKCGIYEVENFKAKPRQYCGITVSDTPLAP